MSFLRVHVEPRRTDRNGPLQIMYGMDARPEFPNGRCATCPVMPARARPMNRGWSPEREAFVQHDADNVLDAAVLIMPLVKFISPVDPRWLSTLSALSEDLVSDSLVHRYDPKASPDGFTGEEGTFSICSFWYVEALTRAGRLDDAQLAFEQLLTYANHVGLYAEQIATPANSSATFRRRSPISR